MPAWAADPDDDRRDDITISGQRQKPIENAPSTVASIDADAVARTVNATNVENAIKYLPSLIV